MFEKEAIRHAFECTIGVECLNKPVEDFTYEELNDEQQEKAYDFQKGAEFGYNKANKRYAELEKENRVLKCFIKDLIYENHNMCFQFSNTTCLFNSDYKNRAEELIGEKLSL